MWQCDALFAYADGLQHLVVVEALTLALALAWDLLLGHVGVRSLAVGLHKVVGRSLEVVAVPVEDQSLLLLKYSRIKKMTQVLHKSETTK